MTKTTHGHAKQGARSPEYRCWIDIKSRCQNPSHKMYPYYGGRGIKICVQWQNSFETFFSVVGPRPTPLHTIDRFPDNDGNYEPGNVRWATRQQQIDNRRTTRIVIVDGQNMSLTQACANLNVSRKMVSARLERGWPAAKALSTPAVFTRKAKNV